MGEYSPDKTGEYPRISPNFQNCARCEKDLKDNKDNSRHLGRKYAQIFVLGHYLFLVAHSFPRASLSENCSLLGTDNREFTKPRRRRQRRRHGTKGLKSRTIAVHVRYNSWYISLPSSARRRHEMTKFCIV